MPGLSGVSEVLLQSYALAQGCSGGFVDCHLDGFVLHQKDWIELYAHALLSSTANK